MIKVNAGYEIKTPKEWIKEYEKQIEKAGRVCYQSDHYVKEGSAEKFVSMILARGHESVIEHAVITVNFISNRGFSHEAVRHRLGSYSQESTRYCNYSKDKFSNEITCVDLEPTYQLQVTTKKWSPEKIQKSLDIIDRAWESAEKGYFELIDMGTPPEIARNILPIGLKTQIAVTYNLRQWREFFRQRTSKFAHPNMREITIPLLEEFKVLLPRMFNDIEV